MYQVELAVPDFNDDQPATLTKISGDGNNNLEIGAKSKIPNIPVYVRCLNCDVNFPTKYQFERHLCEFIEDETELIENDYTDLQNDESEYGSTDEEAPKDKSQVSDSSKDLVSQDAVQQNCKPNHVCKYCSKKFEQHQELIEHIHSHEVNKPHGCTYNGCSARFSLKNSLKDHHRKVHTRERPFKCNICDKRFLTGSVYYQHCLIHKNDRRYACEICGKKFFRSDAVTQHRRIHSGEKPYSCQHCKKSFRQKCDLKRHVKSQHNTI